MKIDQEYLKGLLEALEAEESPTTNISKLKERGFDFKENKFIFHMNILTDKLLVLGVNVSGYGLKIGADGQYSWAIVPLRLTAEGHDFISALRNEEVWSAIKSGLKDASIGTLLSVAKQLLEGYMKNKVMPYIVGS